MKQLFFTLTFLLPAYLQAQIITTVAGCGIGDDSLATKAEIIQPMKIVFDQSGNAYIADYGFRMVRKVSPAGIITTIAGTTGGSGYSGDGGPATAATFEQVLSVAVDRIGNIFVAEPGAHSSDIRKINTSGIISTVAGNGTPGYSGDGGPATAAELNWPTDVIVDSLGNLYIADQYNSVIRKVNASGIISTVPGSGMMAGIPFRIAMGAAGSLYIGCYSGEFIYRLDTSGTLTAIAGIGTSGYSGDGGPATAATFVEPTGLALDTSGNLYFSDNGNDRVRMVNIATGIITTIAGNGIEGYSGDGGTATAAEINWPEGIGFDEDDNLFIPEFENNRIRKLTPGGIISTFAGQNELFGEGYPATNAEMSIPFNIATDVAGNLYIPDLYNNRIRMMNAATGTMTTVAGNGIAGFYNGFSGDGGPATLASIYYPAAVAVDASGNIYIADQENMRVRKVSTSGIITTIAGNGEEGYGGDNGPATAAKLNYPLGVAVDLAGSVYICDGNNYRIRKVNISGIITTVAGRGIAGYSGDGGQATAAEIYPVDVAVDGIGNVYISDNGNNRIRMVDTTGTITTIAGNGTPGPSGDGGAATAAQLNYPNGITVDVFGNIFFSDGGTNVRMINSSGIINTVAGNGNVGFSGDGGPATAAMMDGSLGVAVDGSGNLYIADAYNYRVRKVSLPYLSVPAVTQVSKNISVYPNPATNTLTIASSGPITTITIINLLGQTVHSETGNTTQVQVSVSDLPTGVYFIRVNGTEVRKFVKE